MDIDTHLDRHKGVVEVDIVGLSIPAEEDIGSEEVLDPMDRGEVVLVGPTDRRVALDSNTLLEEVLVHSCCVEGRRTVGSLAAAAAHSPRIVDMEVVEMHNHLVVDSLAQGKHFHFEAAL